MMFDRYRTMLAEHDMVPFERIPWANPRTGLIEPRVLGERPPMHWRVSEDEMARWREYAQTIASDNELIAPDCRLTVFGFDVDEDPSLPPRSIVFERR